MDSLRIILLIIGCLFIVGIYLWDIFSKPEQRKKHGDMLDAIDGFPGYNDESSLSVMKDSDKELDYEFSDMTDLGSLLAQSRNEIHQLDDYNIGLSTRDHVPDDRENNPLTVSTHDHDTGPEFEETDLPTGPDEPKDPETNTGPTFQDMPVEQDDEETVQQPVTQQNENDFLLDEQAYRDIVVLYIVSPRHTLFNGLTISKAAEAAGMVYGHMNVFHHFGPGKLHSGQPLFSMANMFEPGSFDLGKMAELKTKGVAMFMYSPASIDASVVFELFLNTTQRLAKSLRGEILSADREPLTSEKINYLRESAASHQED